MAKLARYFVKSKGCGLNSEHHATAFAHKILFSPRADNSLTLSHNISTTSVRFDISRCPSFMASAIALMVTLAFGCYATPCDQCGKHGLLAMIAMKL